MKTNLSLIIKILFLLLFVPIGFAEEATDIFAHKIGIWEIPASNDLKRWLVIHNLETAKQENIFHIEILGRKKGRPVWDIMRLKDHMAITPKALKESVTRSLKSGAVYPERFDDAFAKWKKQDNQMICSTSVMDCMESQ
jgi:hypothetical protein